MKKFYAIAGLAGAAALLSGCEPLEKTVNFEAYGNTNTAYDADTGALEVLNSEAADPFDALILDNTNSQISENAAADMLTSLSEATDGVNGVYALVAVANDGAVDFTGVTAGTTGTAFVPTAGTGTYDGTYSGIIRETPDDGAQTVSDLITGDVTLTADFAEATISGSIINRNLYDTDGDDVIGLTAADVTLEEATINPDGTFGALATEGEIISAGSEWEVESGSYAGIIGGTSGEYAAGIIVLEQDPVSFSSTSEFTEFGTFEATDD